VSGAKFSVRAQKVLFGARSHPYTQAEKTAEMTRFIGDDLGLDVASLDRNWRLYGGTSSPGPQEGLYHLRNISMAIEILV
jgi:hypothetical protein